MQGQSRQTNGVRQQFRAAGAALQYRWIIARRLLKDRHSSKALLAEGAPDLASCSHWCSFLSTPRSGHSLVGAMLDAHPDAVIGSEYGILDHMIWGFSRERIAALLIADSKRLPHNLSRRTGARRPGGYTYDVEGQWQGRVRKLRLLGDKNGSADTMRIARRRWLVDRIEDTMKADVRFIHVYRNPFDVVSTIYVRAQKTSPGRSDLSGAISLLETRTSAHRSMIADHGPDRVFSLAHEDHLTDPNVYFAALVRWLGLEPDASYLDACAAICFDKPRKTRTQAPWGPHHISRVNRLIEETPFLRRYQDDTPPA